MGIVTSGDQATCAGDSAHNSGTKTRVCKLPEEKFDFLGYTFGRCYSPKTGRAYLGTVPSKKRMTRVCDAIISTQTPRLRAGALRKSPRRIVRPGKKPSAWIGRLVPNP